MKSITFVRHAKSSWEHDLTDIHRPLSIRGYNDANLLSNELLTHNFCPDAIFSSPANRALTTCRIFMDTLNFKENMLTVNEKLYDFDGNQVVKFIYALSDKLSDVMIFGHNHAFTSIVNKFGDKYIDNVPTCGLVSIDFNCDSWIKIDKGHTKKILFPRNLKDR
ncbi:histidine phosphatase family protein [Subsaxibacter sp. CAU 1640]|uniref:SixA phosphatase family protein n=1 Tax=Subsaxibacter sp. CAU 1640 TaxID=2933271 RepID=UPI0020032E79|nr:histidine phosphatase family protein [Subsaxibacter sp. CAU 1640]MCK7591124.1 histidine phosphatase family protein [Subsaxibacter sp. CAU 1640]